MLRRITRATERKDEGFSLVELLVVIIIIGILAAIAIPLFLNQRAKANDTAAKSDVSTLGKEIATLWVDSSASELAGLKVDITGDRYVLSYGSAATPQDLGPVSDGVQMQGTGDVVPRTSGGTLSRTDWCIGVTHPDGVDKDWMYSDEGLSKGTC